ncbi:MULTISPECIES: SMI1/KNR4 family protein [unclassified Paenibacillus]|uniref:SMI1/KNR4 family protein n=1 Tax=unclassified Paenibacillus TaxID=185978 RepID=UPI0009A72793|nr:MULTISPECIES: SMI1/KNR4 family protein [unclassified Paenibacillus]SLK11980.1 SMI1 / KNR4 family (SUKH-1) [Paenibacillus sp. RU5A]SOC72470.1 SMI1 / KNR4 family (SUKH-1) [Paenibacillus sp. RU26A]SOC74883.1 SMI1 / KNR4 family (SUKH-1) [Paenibacillus sp. RU5M]
MNNLNINNIQKHYSIVFPHEYLEFQRKIDGQAFDMIENGEFIDWEIRFSALDDQFIANNINLVDDVNPDPSRIIPFAWSVSSGNNYLLDYRKNSESPVVLVMDHEEAMVREDAESESETPEEAQRLLEENVREIAANFNAFIACLKSRPSDSVE